MAEPLVRQGNDEEDDDEVVTLSVTPKPVDVDFNTNGDEGGAGVGVGVGGKAARLPRWTRQEILVLIQGKRVAENRVRRGRSAAFCEGQRQGQGQVQQQVVEPKWVTVSSYCKRHGVNRGPVQCRKRWSNLAGDFKKIKEWESQIDDESDSFWLMRNDLRRDKKLPGFFDKEVFDILNSPSSDALLPRHHHHHRHQQQQPLFDSGRTAASEDGLFSDFEQSAPPRQDDHVDDDDDGDDDELDDNKVGPDVLDVHIKVEPQPHNPPLLSSTTIPAPTPISEKQYQPKTADAVTGPGTTKEKQRDGLNLEIGSTSREGRKRRRFLEEDDNGEGAPLQNELIQVLERNGKLLSAQLDAYNINLKLDREERRDNANSLVAVLNKLADSMGRIADKL